MERKNRLVEKVREAAINFFQEQKEFKKAQTNFGEVKKDFYGIMSEYYEYNNIEGSKLYIDGEVDSPPLVVTRIQNTRIKFDPDLLEKALGKTLSEDVIIKHYTVNDMFGLIAYLKQCKNGVDPKVFKSFISVSKTVDTKALDQLEALGKITAEQIQGCYTINRDVPYFTVSVGKGQINGEQE